MIQQLECLPKPEGASSPPIHKPRVLMGQCGAAISGPRLMLVTVLRPSAGSWSIDLKRSALLLLADRSQAAAVKYNDEMCEFVTAARLMHVALRGPSAGRLYPGKPLGFLMEGILNLLPGVTVELLNTGVVGRIAKLESEALPHPPGNMPRSLHFLFRHAVCAAIASRRDWK